MNKIIDNEILKTIEDADEYYIVSAKDGAMLPILIGGRWALMKLTEQLKKDELVATTGITGVQCYLILDKTEDECKKLTDKIK